MVTAEFNFHPIGQGSFYSGLIYEYKSPHHYFNCVYDCGVKGGSSRLNEEIESYKNSYRREKLDVLFLSHLDDDHVNGVVQLLTGIRCSKVYLPYLTPIQRLYVAIRSDAEGNDDNNYLGFIGSPHDYLLQQGNIDEIIYVGENSERSFNGIEEITNPTGNTTTVYDNLEVIPERDFSADMSQISIGAGNKVKFKKGNGRISFRQVWEFYFYHKQASMDKVHQLVDKINELYGMTVTEQLSEVDLIRILNNTNQLNKLRGEFKKVFGDINRAGLLIQHKPINYKRAELFKNYQVAPFFHHFSPLYRRFSRQSFKIQNPTNEHKWGVTLLTGDIGLNQIDDSTYINKNKESVRVFQIPHHGSNTGWDANYLEHLNHNGLTSAIINFGYSNTHGHPTYKVLSDLEERNFEICFCNQFEGFNYEFVIDPKK